MQDTLEELDKDTCAAFALFWNLCHSWVPAEIIDDIDTFTIGAGLPPMDSKIQDTHTGNYKSLWAHIPSPLQMHVLHQLWD